MPSNIPNASDLPKYGVRDRVLYRTDDVTLAIVDEFVRQCRLKSDAREYAIQHEWHGLRHLQVAELQIPFYRFHSFCISRALLAFLKKALPKRAVCPSADL